MINGAELLRFEIAVMDLCEEMKVDNVHDLEELSYRLHQCIELAITEYKKATMIKLRELAEIADMLDNQHIGDNNESYI
jgi:hypothetical protein